LDVKQWSLDVNNKIGRQQSFISIGAGFSQLPLILTAKNLGYAVIAVDRNPEAPGFQHADICIKHSTYDIDAILDSLRSLKNNYEFKGCLARTTGQPLYTMVEVLESFDLPGLNRGLVSISIEKSILKEFCLNHDISTPPGLKVDSIEELTEQLSLPIIIKPDSTLVGKSGIRLCVHDEKLYTYLLEAIDASENRQAVIESFVAGVDATCLCFAHEGSVSFITWWDELVGIDINNKIISLGVNIPSIITGTIAQQKAEQIIEHLVYHFPTTSALLLISFRINIEGEPYIIEIHSDLGGDLIAELLLPASSPDFDFFTLAIQVATGSVEKINTINFKPTVLYYHAGELSLSEGLGKKCKEHLICQCGSVIENLLKLPQVVNIRNLTLSVWPSHLDWMRQIALKGGF